MPRHKKSGAPSQRMLRVGELVRHTLSAFLTRNDISDPDLSGVVLTVPEVRMTPDLKLASVYVMPLGGDNAPQVVDALNRNRKFIRGGLAPLLALKYAPDLRFFVDDTFDEADRINAILASERVQRDLRDDSETSTDKTD